MSGFYPLYVTAALTSQIQEVGMLRLELWDVGNGGFGSIGMDDGAIVALDSDGNVISFGGGSGDMILATAQTVTAAKTFNNATLLMRNVANTFSAQFTNTNTAARTYTLPDAAGTIALTSNITGTNSGTNTGDQTITLTGMVTGSGTGSFAASLGSFTKSQLDTAISDGNVLYVGDAPTAHSTDLLTSGTLPVARGGTGLTAVGTSLQVLRTNAGATALEYATITSGSGDALVANPLSQFAATTSAQLAGVISNKTGSDLLVFATSPTLTTPNIGAATGTSLAVTGALTAGNGIVLSGASGSATTISTSTTNANIIITPQGTGKVMVGDTSSTLTANPRVLSLGGTYGTNVAGGAGNIKLGIYDDGANLNGIGFEQGVGMSFSTSSAQNMAFYAGRVLRLTISSSGIATTGTVTIGSGTPIAKVLSATATLDFSSIASNDTHTLTMTVTGAVAGNSVFVGVPAALDANLIWCASVTAADTVTIRMHNSSGASIDPASGTYRATVFQF